MVWRVQFSPAITSQVISDANPRGKLTNSDLEMAALLLHYMVLQQEVDLRFVRAGVWSDNTPTVAWTKRMADRSQGPTAGRLLRGLAAFQRATQAGPLTIGHIAGKTNDMADVASRSFDPVLVHDPAFLTHFHTLFPLPQSQSWRLVHLMPAQTSLVTSTLDGKRLPLPQWTTASKPKIGTRGLSSAVMLAETRTSPTPPNQCSSSYSSVSLRGSGAVTTAADIKSMLRPQKPPSVTWRKPSSWLATQIPGGPTDPKTWTSPSPASCAATNVMTQPHNPS
jgi:hypothetical protein